MNPTLQAELDKLTVKLAGQYSTSEKLVNICIQVALLVTKLGVFGTFATSKHINVAESVQLMSVEVGNIVLVAGALAGMEDAEKLMKLYQEVAAEVARLSQNLYTQAANTKEKAS